MPRITGGPTTPYLLVNSIGRAAADATWSVGKIEEWVKQVEEHVAVNGQYHHFGVLYSPWAPPPVLWDYKCRKCRWWQEPRECKVVMGDINGNGWCVLWVPPADYRAGTWPMEFIGGDW